MASLVPAYHLPYGVPLWPRPEGHRQAASPAAAGGPLSKEDAETFGLAIPEPTPTVLAATAERLRAAAAPLKRMPTEERIAAIDRAAARWLSPASTWRQVAIEKLPLVTGYPAAAVSVAIDRLWHALRAPELAAAVRAESARASGGAQATGRAPLAARVGVLPSGEEPACRLAVHLLAGNVPGVGVFGVVAGLLAGVPSLVKTARREPLLPALVARSLAAEDPRLGCALAVLHWRGGETDLDSAALASADVVLAYGRAETLSKLAVHRAPRLLSFGPRLSLGLITREAADGTTAENAAFEVALFDQQGCLSPQFLLIEEGKPAASQRFATALAAALARLAVELPRAPLSLAESTAIWRFIEEQRWRAQEGEPVRVEADAGGRFGVVYDSSGTVAPSPLNRHVVVAPVTSLRAATSVLAPLKGLIEAVGYAGPEHRLGEAAAVAAACGAERLCPLERMQAPPFAWRQSGHARLASFVTPAAEDGRSEAVGLRCTDVEG